MSYMDRKNILEEGFLDNFINKLKKVKSKITKSDDKDLEKQFQKALKGFKDQNKALSKRLKANGIEDPFAGL